MTTRTRRTSALFLKLLPAVAMVGLVGCNGLPLGLLTPGNATGVNAADEARFKPAATEATFAPEFKAVDADKDNAWSAQEFASYLAKNPLPEAFLLELEAAAGYQLAQAEIKATAESTVQVLAPTPGLDPRTQALITKILNKFDADKDGKLSAAEALAFRNEGYKRRARPAAGNNAPTVTPPNDKDEKTNEKPGMGLPPNQILPGQDGLLPNRPNRDDCLGETKRWDTDQNGSISWEEQWAGMMALENQVLSGAMTPGAKDRAYEEFKRRDANGDGQLSPEERCMGVTNDLPMQPPPADGDCYGQLKRADRDGDARLSWEEFYMGYVLGGRPATDPALKDQANQRFMKFDANADGFLSVEEWGNICPPTTGGPMPPAPGDCVKVHDRNGDGRLSLEEWLGAHPNVRPEDLKLKFEGADRNRDGFLDAVELGCGEPMTPNQPGMSCEEGFKAFDTNRDGRLDLGEYSAWKDKQNIPTNTAVMPSIARDWSAEFKTQDRNADRFIDPAEACGNATQPPVSEPNQPKPPVASPPVSNPNVNPCDEFKRRDRNADGQVTLDEHIAAANPQGAEAKAQLEAEFTNRDANRDRVLVPAEVGCK